MTDTFPITFLDGGTGTLLQARGLAGGEAPETWNVTRPEEIKAVHAAYARAGSDIVCSCTFGANRVKYAGAAALEEIIPAAVRHARASGARVALDIGPCGRLLKPAGDFSFEEAYAAFAETIRLGAAEKPDLVLIETMGDTRELKAAVLAAKENCALPIYATVALNGDGKLLTGGDVAAVAALLEALGVAALGFNCGLGPDRMLPFVTALRSLTRLPIIVKPNAGLPQVVGGKTVFPVGPEDFARETVALVKAGASIVGGCCGTTPAHIAAVRAALRGVSAYDPKDLPPRACVVSSGTHAVTIPFGDTRIVGERLNPTGKRKLKEALSSGDTAYILREAVAQADNGAHILDVNVGVPGLDERTLLSKTVEAVQSVSDLPIQIDTADPAALEAALRTVNGKPLVNSVSGKRESLDAVLPLVAKYGGTVVALTLDENGIPATAEGRLAIARKILAEGAKYHLTKEDFVIDCLCLAVSAEPAGGRVILETLRRVRDELKCRTCLGVSNISFALPARPILNATFLSLAMEAGLSLAIVNPLSAEMRDAYRATRALLGRDAQCAAWIAGTALPAPEAAPAFGAAAQDDLAAAIRHGLKADAARLAEAAVKGGTEAIALIDREIVPALEGIGRGFETGQIFLPQLLMAAEAAAAAFEVIKKNLEKGAASLAPEKGPVVFATVKGDIHDIGKNICCSLLANYGFKVIDLGRDVAPEAVLAAVEKSAAPIVGLSALMTTTVGAMADTIRLIHAKRPGCKVIVGGAVLTADFAGQIGADAYSHDAMEMVRLCERMKG